MKACTGTPTQMIALKFAYFDLGAPFTAVLYGDYWHEPTKGVYSDERMVGGTFALENVFPYLEGSALKHIDDYTFAPYTFQYYLDTYLNNVAIQERIPRDEEGEPLDEWLIKTPQQWVSEVIIGDNYVIVDIP
jgi:hypothetical protein